MDKKRDSKYFGKVEVQKKDLNNSSNIETKKKIKKIYDDFKMMFSYQEKTVKFAKYIETLLKKK